jgi:hypothetical protein
VTINQNLRFSILGSTDYTSLRNHWNRLFCSSIPSDSNGPRNSELWLLRVRNRPGAPHCRRFLRHLPPLPRSPCSLSCRAFKGAHLGLSRSCSSANIGGEPHSFRDDAKLIAWLLIVLFSLSEALVFLGLS